MSDEKEQLNVWGSELSPCSITPMTGFYRDGNCATGEDDHGRHVVCIEVTADFLEFSKSRGNDLSTPMPEFGFAGLKPGDRWCLCGLRWKEAYEADMAPRIVLASTHITMTEIVPIEILKQYAVDLC
jgi:uncharacterized protein